MGSKQTDSKQTMEATNPIGHNMRSAVISEPPGIAQLRMLNSKRCKNSMSTNSTDRIGCE
jgi:hypothetical protein